MEEFPAARLDRATWVVTASALVVVVGATVVAVLALEGAAGRAVAIGIATLILLLCWGYAPAAFEVGSGTLEIRRRLFGRKRFSLTGRAHRRTKESLSGLVMRKFGSGGLFGSYGSFWSRDLGSFRAYVTDSKKVVLCQTDRGPVMVTPADPDGLLAALNGVAP